MPVRWKGGQARVGCCEDTKERKRMCRRRVMHCKARKDGEVNELKFLGGWMGDSELKECLGCLPEAKTSC